MVTLLFFLFLLMAGLEDPMKAINSKKKRRDKSDRSFPFSSIKKKRKKKKHSDQGLNQSLRAPLILLFLFFSLLKKRRSGRRDILKMESLSASSGSAEADFPSIVSSKGLTTFS